jgi:hypothetical protein
MFTIIGGDGKEYGPVTDADVRQWIAEGRLSAQSQAKGEGDAEFRPLAQFPEFADALAPQTPTIIAPSFSSGEDTATDANPARLAARQQVKAPALAMKIVAALNFALATWDLIKLAFFPPQIDQLMAAYPQLNDPAILKWLHLFYGPLGICDALFGMVMSVLIYVGAGKMQSLTNYEFAFVGAILAMVPCLTPCCFLGLPMGIWALVVLNRAKIKSEFH